MIIGITGTDGAGKGAVVDFLVKEKGFTHISSRDTINIELEKEGIEKTRNNMRLKANQMRAQFGDDVLVAKAYERIEQEGIENAVVESLRAAAEAVTLKQKGGILLAIDADQKLRYERVQGRRSSSDKVTFEQFMEHEQMEMNDPDPHGMQKAKVMEMADHTIMNDGSFKELHRKIEEFLAAIDK